MGLGRGIGTWDDMGLTWHLRWDSSSCTYIDVQYVLEYIFEI
jgi:hypothetical protein